jgi:hypothetical protein
MIESVGKLFTAALAVSVACGLAACERSSEPQGGAPNAAIEPSATAAQAQATPTLHVIEGKLIDGEMQFEDDLVLLGEGNPDWGEAPLTVRFTVESLVTDQMNGPTYAWNFGDGSAESNEAAPVHTFEKPGNYAVTVKVTDASGETGWDELDVEVVEPQGEAGKKENP